MRGGQEGQVISPMRRRRFIRGVGVDCVLRRGQAVGQAFEFALEAVDVFPLGGDGLVQVLDRALLMGEADFEFVDAG